MDKDNEIELVQTIQEKDKQIRELKIENENITRELLSRTEKLSEVLEKQKDSVPKDKIREKIKYYEEIVEKGGYSLPFNRFKLVALKELLGEE